MSIAAFKLAFEVNNVLYVFPDHNIPQLGPVQLEATALQTLHITCALFISVYHISATLNCVYDVDFWKLFRAHLLNAVR